MSYLPRGLLDRPQIIKTKQALNLPTLRAQDPPEGVDELFWAFVIKETDDPLTAGGIYYWDSNSFANDDGYYVIRPDNSLGNGRWIRFLVEAGETPQVSVLNFANVQPNNSLFNNGLGFVAAIDALRGTGISLFIPEGDYYFTTGFQVRTDVWVVGASAQAVNLIASVGGFTLVEQKSPLHLQAGITRVTLTGADATNPNSVAIDFPLLDGSTKIGATSYATDIYLGEGWYDGVRMLTECDCAIISGFRSTANFGRSFMYIDVPTAFSFAPSACVRISNHHIARQNPSVYRQNIYGIYLFGCDATGLDTNIINGFDHSFFIGQNTTVGGQRGLGIDLTTPHVEDLRPFVNTQPQRANSTAYTTSTERMFNNYVFTVTIAGTTASSPPTFNYTIGATTVDGTVTWTCVSRHSAEWVPSRVYQLGELVKPSATYVGYHAVFEVTVAGTGGLTEPTWPDAYDATITDGTATLKLTVKSEAFHFEANNFRTYTINDAYVLGNLNAVTIGGRASVVANRVIMQSDSRAFVRNALYCYALTERVDVLFDHCECVGNIIPYNVAPSDTFICVVNRKYGTAVDDNLEAVSLTDSGDYGAWFNKYKYLEIAGSGTLDLSRPGMIISSSTGTITVPAASRYHEGNVYRIQARHSNGVTVSFPASVVVNGETVSSVYLPRNGSYVEFGINNLSTIFILGIGPEYQATLNNSVASGTDGGTFTSGSWQTIPLNTEVTDAGQFVTLASNEFTLLPGAYVIDASAPGFKVNGFRIRIYNVTDATNLASGQTNYSAAADDVATYATVSRYISNTTSKTYRIEGYCNTTRATDGLGKAMGIASTNEIYARVSIQRLF